MKLAILAILVSVASADLLNEGLFMMDTNGDGILEQVIDNGRFLRIFKNKKTFISVRVFGWYYINGEVE